MGDRSGELILVRHAPTDPPGRLCGRTDAGARIDPARLAPLKARLAPVRLWASSPARRCTATAAALGAPAAARDARLWEQDFGAEDGLPFAALPDLGPLSGAELAARVPPGGESFAAACARIAPALRDWAARAAEAGGAAVLVAHAGTVRAALALAIGAPGPALAFEVAPLSVSRFRSHEGGLSVISVNEAPA
ncbi:histidine phosphatase family protein [Roseivivax sp. CAU 1761]